MLQERLQAFREAEKEILVCLGNAPQAQRRRHSRNGWKQAAQRDICFPQNKLKAG